MEPQTNAQPGGNTETTTTPVSEEKKEAAGPEKTATKISFSVIGYIIPFLFFLPLLDDKTKHDPVVRFHANQQLILLIVIGAVYLLHGTILFALSSLGDFIVQLLSVSVIVLMAIGAYNAHRGKMNELPFIGQFRLLK